MMPLLLLLTKTQVDWLVLVGCSVVERVLQILR